MTLNRNSTKEATLDELLSYHDEKFVHSAYYNLLGRPPDPEGLRYYLASVRTGICKVEILAQLRRSAEGRSRGTKIDGLDKAIKRHRLLRTPLLGSLLRLAGTRETGNRKKSFRVIENQLHVFDTQLAQLLHQSASHQSTQLSLLKQALSERDVQVASIEQAVIQQTVTITELAQLVHQSVLNQESQLSLLKHALSERDAQLVSINQAALDPQVNIAEGPLGPLSSDPAQTFIEDVVRVDFRFWKTFRIPCEVEIIICVHNALDDVKRCLSSVVRFSAPPCRIIIVDDGSREDTREYLRSFCREQGAPLIRNDEARGYTFAANQGMRASTGGYVILLNSDTIVSPGWVEKLVACAESDPNIGLVGPLSNTASWQSIPEILENGDWATNPLPAGMSVSEMGGLVAKYSAHAFPKVSFLNGFCLVIRRAVIEQIGMFDEEAFGRGYGEENDYCLRARKAGWTLALADNAYVFHAQSKSYSHEKRKALADLAGQQLATKHGNEIITAGVEQCRWDHSLLSLRARARVMLEREGAVTSGRKRWEGRRVLFVLPVTHSGGGGNVVITEARAMMRMGVNVALVNLSVHRPVFELSYPNLDVPLVYVDSPEEIQALGRDFDAVVATANRSVQWIAPLASEPDGPVLGYYIQDFEPYFFEPGTAVYDVALSSYSLVPGMRLFTKTQWNRDEVLTQTGLTAEIVGPSYDSDLFGPRSQRTPEDDVRVRIVAMIRPSSPRRNPEGTIAVLASLQQRFGERIELAIFGAEAHEIAMLGTLSALKVKNYGHLRPEQTVRLLSNSDIFVDMSFFQAMGLTAMEAMACGAVAILPRAGGVASFARHNGNALIVNTENLKEAVDATSELIEDSAKRRALQVAALEDINHFYPEKVANAILEHLFN